MASPRGLTEWDEDDGESSDGAEDAEEAEAGWQGSTTDWKFAISWAAKRSTLVYNLLLNVSQVECLGGLVVCGYVGHLFSRSLHAIANHFNARNVPPWPLPTSGCLPSKRCTG
eukprot:GGOE01036324.1.p2 GENE.GGOE01036324.1~~GGOE01036324.1.p2  ORF type:complete len:113 (-),score=10.75 GGOE01036324.1:255-593(-)